MINGRPHKKIESEKMEWDDKQQRNVRRIYIKYEPVDGDHGFNSQQQIHQVPSNSHIQHSLEHQQPNVQRHVTRMEPETRSHRQQGTTQSNVTRGEPVVTRTVGEPRVVRQEGNTQTHLKSQHVPTTTNSHVQSHGQSHTHSTGKPIETRVVRGDSNIVRQEGNVVRRDQVVQGNAQTHSLSQHVPMTTQSHGHHHTQSIVKPTETRVVRGDSNLLRQEGNVTRKVIGANGVERIEDGGSNRSVGIAGAHGDNSVIRRVSNESNVPTGGINHTSGGSSGNVTRLPPRTTVTGGSTVHSNVVHGGSQKQNLKLEVIKEEDSFVQYHGRNSSAYSDSKKTYAHGNIGSGN